MAHLDKRSEANGQGCVGALIFIALAGSFQCYFGLSSGGEASSWSLEVKYAQMLAIKKNLERVTEGDRPWVWKLTWQSLKRVPCHLSLMMEGSGFLTVPSVLRFGAGVEG